MPSKIEKTNFDKMRTTFFFGLIIILGLAILYLFKPFFYPIFWAAIIAIMFYSVYQWLLKYLHFKTLCSLLTIIIVVAIIIIPLTILSTLVINQSISLYQNVSQGELIVQVKGVSKWLENTPAAPYLEEIRNYWNLHAQSFAKTVSIFLLENLKNFTQNSLEFLGLFFLMLYTLFYFFKDGPRMLKRLMHLSPLGDEYEQMIFHRFTSTARATLKGTLFVGAIQGILGGILFYITGIQGSVVWGVIMAVASIIPALGTGIIWLPAGIIMLATGNVWQGITILIVGLAVIGTIDNLLRPKVVGRDIEMHPLLVLFSTLGGIIFFGISGIIIGPVIAALFLAIITIYEHHYKTELNNN